MVQRFFTSVSLTAAGILISFTVGFAAAPAVEKTGASPTEETRKDPSTHESASFESIDMMPRRICNRASAWMLQITTAKSFVGGSAVLPGECSADEGEATGATVSGGPVPVVIPGSTGFVTSTTTTPVGPGSSSSSSSGGSSSGPSAGPSINIQVQLP